MKIESGLAILDVTDGRSNLATRIENDGKPAVVILGVISDKWSRDDGVSAEFQVDVADVVLSDFGDNEQSLSFTQVPINEEFEKVSISYIRRKKA